MELTGAACRDVPALKPAPGLHRRFVKGETESEGVATDFKPTARNGHDFDELCTEPGFLVRVKIFLEFSGRTPFGRSDELGYSDITPDASRIHG